MSARARIVTFWALTAAMAAGWLIDPMLGGLVGVAWVVYMLRMDR